jgi:multiple sugar transport system substrate-binding protein
MKRIISSIIALVLVLSFCVGTMASCNVGDVNVNVNGGPAGNDEVVIPEEGFDTTKPVTITFYHQMGAALQEILNSAIEDFNELYPNITVEHSSYGDYNGVRDQIKTEISVGNQPNLAYCYPDHIALYNIAGAVQTLDSLIDGQYGFTAEQKADFVPAYYNEGKAFGDGKMYSLPISKSTEVLYYNETFFKEHNLTVPKTWDEMEAVCRQIKEIDPSCIPLGYDSEANWFITMCEQYGSDYTATGDNNFLFDNDTNKNFVKKFRSWYQEKLVTTEELSGGYTSALFTGESDSGTRCYMCIGSTGGATYQQPNQTNGEYEFEVGITSIPQVDPANPKVISQGPSLCIFKNADTQEVIASWLFAKFLTTDVNFQASVSMNNGYAPVIQSVKNNQIYADFLASASTANIQAYAVKVALDQANAYYVSPAFNGSSVARDQVGLLIQKCFALEGDDVDAAIAKAFKDAVAECKYQSGQ